VVVRGRVRTRGWAVAALAAVLSCMSCARGKPKEEPSPLLADTSPRAMRALLFGKWRMLGDDAGDAGDAGNPRGATTLELREGRMITALPGLPVEELPCEITGTHPRHFVVGFRKDETTMLLFVDMPDRNTLRVDSQEYGQHTFVRVNRR